MKNNKVIIGVIGDWECGPEVYAKAEAVGFEIARRGATLICGGYGGVMEAASKGAKRGGGLTVGILSGKETGEANQYIDIPIVTGMRDARNVIIARTADALIAVSGGFGTLSEIGFALKFGKPLAGLGTWKLEHSDPNKSFSLKAVATPEEAVQAVFAAVTSGGHSE